jgi:hypothetical protein
MEHIGPPVVPRVVVGGLRGYEVQKLGVSGPRFDPLDPLP